MYGIYLACGKLIDGTDGDIDMCWEPTSYIGYEFTERGAKKFILNWMQKNGDGDARYVTVNDVNQLYDGVMIETNHFGNYIMNIGYRKLKRV